jgi:hypothetical protein
MNLPLTGGDAPRIAGTTVVALYDRDSGRILHLHTVYRYESAPTAEGGAAIAEAQVHARRLGHDTGRLGAAVSTNVEHARIPHRIDVESGGFVPLA